MKIRPVMESRGKMAQHNAHRHVPMIQRSLLFIVTIAVAAIPNTLWAQSATCRKALEDLDHDVYFDCSRREFGQLSEKECIQVVRRYSKVLASCPRHAQQSPYRLYDWSRSHALDGAVENLREHRKRDKEREAQRAFRTCYNEQASVVGRLDQCKREGCAEAISASSDWCSRCNGLSGNLTSNMSVQIVNPICSEEGEVFLGAKKRSEVYTAHEAARSGTSMSAAPEQVVLGAPLCSDDYAGHCMSFPGWEASPDVWREALFAMHYETPHGERAPWKPHDMVYKVSQSVSKGRMERKITAPSLRSIPGAWAPSGVVSTSVGLPQELSQALRMELLPFIEAVPEDFHIEGCVVDGASGLHEKRIYRSASLLHCRGKVIAVGVSAVLIGQDPRWTLNRIQNLDFPWETVFTDHGVHASPGDSNVRWSVRKVSQQFVPYMRQMGTIRVQDQMMIDEGAKVTRALVSASAASDVASVLVEDARNRWVEEMIGKHGVQDRDELLDYFTFLAATELKQASVDEAEVERLIGGARFVSNERGEELRTLETQLHAARSARLVAEAEAEAERQMHDMEARERLIKRHDCARTCQTVVGCSLGCVKASAQLTSNDDDLRLLSGVCYNLYCSALPPCPDDCDEVLEEWIR